MKFWHIVGALVLVAYLSAANSAQAVVLKIGTMSPAGGSWMTKMEEGAAEVEKKTEGRVKFKFYPGGVMGDDKTVLRKMKIGQLQGGAVLSGSLSEIYHGMRVYGMPMLFKSPAEVEYVRAKMDPILEEGLEKAGYVTFGLADGGFAYLMSKAPVKTVDDLKKQKVWIPDNDLTTQRAVKDFGITPIPLSVADVRTGLQTGLIDTVGVSPIGAIALQWHTQVKYLTDLPLLYLFGVFIVDQKAFKAISPSDQKIVREVMGNTFKTIDQENKADNAKATEALKQQGIIFVKPSSQYLAEWDATAEGTADAMAASGDIPADLLKSVRDYLKTYREKGQ